MERIRPGAINYFNFHAFERTGFPASGQFVSSPENRQLKRARELIAAHLTASLTVEASLIAGYSGPTNFAKAFRRRYDLSPREVLSAGPMR